MEELVVLKINECFLKKLAFVLFILNLYQQEQKNGQTTEYLISDE